jgi:hypothetical protein
MTLRRHDVRVSHAVSGPLLPIELRANAPENKHSIGIVTPGRPLAINYYQNITYF